MVNVIMQIECCRNCADHFSEGRCGECVKEIYNLAESNCAPPPPCWPPVIYRKAAAVNAALFAAGHLLEGHCGECDRMYNIKCCRNCADHLSQGRCGECE